MSADQLNKLIANFRKYPFDFNAKEADLRKTMDMMGKAFQVPEGVAVSEVTLGGVPAERVSAGDAGPAVLYLHGGGYVMGSPLSHRHLAGLLAAKTGGTVYTLDYRLAPEHPYPAALDDAVAAWTDLTAQGPAAIAGDSAGGGLTFALALAARERGLPTATCLVGISPMLTATTDSSSYDLLAKVDPTLSRPMAEWYMQRYVGDADLRDPMISPLYADLQGLPPVLLQCGDREVFYGDVTDMHQRLLGAGVDSSIRIWPRMFHVWHLYWPRLDEGVEGVAEVADFVVQHSA